jgi:LmbE family N-acetylglucosaminyl deacetylase
MIVVYYNKIMKMNKTPALKQEHKKSKTVAIIIAHPDDETLWAGGTILGYPSWQWFVVCLCRASDKDRAPRFYKTLKVFNSEGIMGNLDDEPEQKPLDEKDVEHAILDLLPQKHFDLIISHNPTGEYTRHLRHEEASKAVIKLWHAGKISTNELWTFAYEDGGKEFYPRPVENATIYRTLTKRIWLRKYRIITKTYGFEKNSWEAETTTKAESFWKFTDPNDAKKWLNNGGVFS